MDHLSDEEIVLAYRKGKDMELLGLLYRKYMVLVYGVCMKYLKNREESQDAVMQIFEILVKDIPRFEIRNFKAWLYGVTKNHCLMYLRKYKKEKFNRAPEFSSEFVESENFLHPDDENNNEEILAKLASCLEELKDSQRDCVQLFYLKRKCYKEIAAELKLDEKKVKSFIQNGKRNLKICMEKGVVLKNV